MKTVITLHNDDARDLDSGMLSFAFQVAARHAPQASTIDIYPQGRVPDDAADWQFPGRLEWMIRVVYRRYENPSRTGGSLTIGLLQRTKDSEFESHT